MNPVTKPSSATTKVTYDEAWARSVIGYWTHVRVRDIDTRPATLTFGPDITQITQITVTVITTWDARRLAALLDLPAEAADPAQAWQTWAGWVSEFSAHRPVLVRVTAPASVPREA